MTVDYVIVGGGAVGCALAWRLAERGAAVQVLERSEVAAGASGGPGARGIRANGRDLRELPLIRRAQELWPTLADRLGCPTGYQRTGGLRLVEQEVVGVRGGRVSLQAHAWAQRNAGIASVVVGRDELDHLEPGLATTVTHALLCPDDGTAEHETTTRSLAAAARRAGAVVRERSSLQRLSWSGGRVTAVETEDERIVPRCAVVLTANAGSGALLSPRVPYLPTWTVVPQVCFVRPRTPVTLRHLVGHESRTVSLKSAADGMVQVSGGWRGRWDADRGHGVVDPRTTTAAMREAAAVLPALENAVLVAADAARTETCSPDGLPIIDAVPGSENVYLATGWSGHGFALVPAVCEALADWLLSGRRPAVLEPFAYTRFDHRAAHDRLPTLMHAQGAA